MLALLSADVHATDQLKAVLLFLLPLQNGWSVVFEAAIRGNADILRLILEVPDVDVNMEDKVRGCVHTFLRIVAIWPG